MAEPERLSGEDGQASRQNANTAPWSPFAQLGQRLHYDERSHRDQFQVLFGDYYSPSMLGLKTDQEVLGELVRTKLPAVAALMDSHGLLWTLVVSRWFICLFVDVLPVETVLRIWDCLFNEGSKIIFRVALTLIKQHQALILEATSVPDICEKFKEITRGSFVTECHTFMQVGVGALLASLRGLPGPPRYAAQGGASALPGQLLLEPGAPGRPGVLTLAPLLRHQPRELFGAFRSAVVQLRHWAQAFSCPQRAPQPQPTPCSVPKARPPGQCDFGKIFSEPGSLSRAGIARLRERCRARLLAQG
ncbi:hypothetical protein J1605_009344 [Eschrichtius robustus]|uniref:Rab-GAP TBC domain-containing protein n=1 Tax=Eschrichtius robustus TaxID=9764 RepID=A0AB34GWX1_ESCRO|nr:hypothetical protein J1605_009344 [Eschrichtius robustus]